MLFGHSIGATFLLSVLEQISPSYQPAAAILVGGFISDLPDAEFNKINQSFYQKDFDWDKLKKNNFTIIHSPNDPFVPMDRAQLLADKLESRLTTILNAGHFNTASGYTKFPELIAELERRKILAT